MSFNPLSINNITTTTSVPATNGFLQVNPSNITITATGPETVPHFDCDDETERDITDILIYHDIFVDVKKLKKDDKPISLNEGTRWTFQIYNNLYKIKFIKGTLYFHKPDGNKYRVTHENIPKLLLAIIHNQMGSCDKCAIPTSEFLFFQIDRGQFDIYDRDSHWLNIGAAGMGSAITFATTT